MREGFGRSMSFEIRILRVLGSLNRGGIETNILNLYRKTDRNKVQFDFIIHTQDICSYEKEISELGGKIYRIPNFTGENYFQYKKAWEDFFNNHREYKIIHCHLRSTASIYIPIAKKYGLITIAHSHNTSSGSGFQAVVKNILQIPIRYQADYLLACSEDAGKWLFGRKAIHKDTFKVIYNSIDSKQYIYSELKRKDVRKRLGIKDNAYVIGNVGRFHPQKNHSFLIKVFEKIYQKNKNAVLLLVGDGTLRNKIQNQVTKKNLSGHVIMTGETSKVYDMLQAMDVFIFPSLFEGFGNVLLEAQSNGLPCIISDRIPKSTHVIPSLIHVLSLESDIDLWVNAAFKSKRETKIACAELVAEAGFDVYKTAEWYQNFYLELYKNEGNLSLKNL